jgi:hypothetical protein
LDRRGRTEHRDTWSSRSQWSRGAATLAAGFLIAAVLAGCGRAAQRGAADVPECRRAAADVQEFAFDTGVAFLQRQADAYSGCMVARGYVLDQAQLEEQLLHFQQVQYADIPAGDPILLISVRREKLRMSRSLWHTPAAPKN